MEMMAAAIRLLVARSSRMLRFFPVVAMMNENSPI